MLVLRHVNGCVKKIDSDGFSTIMYMRSMKYLYVKSIGTVEREVTECVAAAVSSLFTLPCRLIEDTTYPLFAFEPRRNQYYAKEIIKHMSTDLPSDCEKMVGITDVDLCTPVLTFVYGEAQLGGTVAIISLKRLRQEFYHLPRNDTVLCERIVKECIHELGHCYGLFHCCNHKCAMCFSSSIVSIDNKESTFCVGCTEFLHESMRKEYHEQI